jgi:hypothetical protein
VTVWGSDRDPGLTLVTVIVGWEAAAGGGSVEGGGDCADAVALEPASDSDKISAVETKFMVAPEAWRW